jgi:hypothetical protein
MAGIAGGHNMRTRLRRLGGTALALAALIAASAVLPAVAQTTSQRDMRQVQRPMPGKGNGYIFKVGVLQRDHLARWVLSDGTVLRADDRTVWVDEALGAAAAYPAEGRTARIMGQNGPGGLLVRYGVLRDQGDVSQSLQMAPIAEPDTPEPRRPQ